MNSAMYLPCLLACLSMLCLSRAVMLPEDYTHTEKRAPIVRRKLPWAGNGTCEEPVVKDGYTTVRCLGPEQPMLPGTTLDAYVLLESPYPVGKMVAAVHQVSQLVAKTGPDSWRPVPLSEVYFHHVVSSPKFLLGEGAEVRGSRLRKPLPEPYAFIINGTEAAEIEIRKTNLQLVNTVGVPSKDLQSAYECWCDTEYGQNATRGSLFCCTQRATTSYEGYTTYQLEYNVTYRDVREGDRGVDLFGYDVTYGKIEYNIAEPLGPGVNHTKVAEYPFDYQCPQNKTVEIVRCTAHQHIGSKCMHVYNAENNDLICSSCPIYGQEKDVPGNELGYVVAIEDEDLTPPYKIDAGTRVRVESVYDGSQERLGVMGILVMWFGGVSSECQPRNHTSPSLAHFTTIPDQTVTHGVMTA